MDEPISTVLETAPSAWGRWSVEDENADFRDGESPPKIGHGTDSPVDTIAVE
ncbi:hypothetical protein [Natronolimnohabitans innermongolicus]|nr:hypothetical protein [Natronolimnohabitans innermongolicus]